MKESLQNHSIKLDFTNPYENGDIFHNPPSKGDFISLPFFITIDEGKSLKSFYKIRLYKSLRK